MLSPRDSLACTLVLKLQNKTEIILFDRPVCFFVIYQNSFTILKATKQNLERFSTLLRSGRRGSPILFLSSFPRLHTLYNPICTPCIIRFAHLIQSGLHTLYNLIKTTTKTVYTERYNKSQKYKKKHSIATSPNHLTEVISILKCIC